MSRSVLLTGSAGFLGRALRARFESIGDTVIGVDLPGTDADIPYDLDEIGGDSLMVDFDILVANAKCKTCEAHHELARRARQCIVNVSSIYALLGCDPAMYAGTEIPPTPSDYVAVKGAMIALTRHQATTLAPVRSNCVVPGGIWRNHSPEFTKRYSAKVPLKRMATEEDIVGVIEFLCSDAARYVTGCVIPVDGGASCMM